MVLNIGVEKQFNVFKDAFLQVCGGRVLRLFHSQELMAVVVGNQDYDWIELEKNAQYRNGYTQDDETIKLFWEVFHEFDIDHKKKFLLFLTGSDRVPVMGMKAIKVRYIIIIICFIVIFQFCFFSRFIYSQLKMIIFYQWHTHVSIF
jgi:E3 ubiquitin-protein ligase HERC4